MIEEVAGVSLITPDRLANLVNAVERTAHLPGGMAELGVYRGGSAKVIASVCPDKLLRLFDTFTGLPQDETQERDPDGYCREGMFAAREEEVREYLKGCNAMIYRGHFPMTARGLGNTIYSFVHVDCDLYSGARDAISFFWPLLVSGGILYFDDYGCKFTGVTEAVDEAFTAAQIEKQYDCHGYQIGALVVKE